VLSFVEISIHTQCIYCCGFSSATPVRVDGFQLIILWRIAYLQHKLLPYLSSKLCASSLGFVQPPYSVKVLC
jgi:hypothetical protein